MGYTLWLKGKCQEGVRLLQTILTQPGTFESPQQVPNITCQSDVERRESIAKGGRTHVPLMLDLCFPYVT